MDCGKKGIGEFELTKGWDPRVPHGQRNHWTDLNQIMYKYKCSGKATTGPCREDLLVTGTSHINNNTYPAEVLDELHPKCNDDEVLTKVRFLKHTLPTWGSTGSYKYTCCGLGEGTAVYVNPNPEPEPEPVPVYSDHKPWWQL